MSYTIAMVDELGTWLASELKQRSWSMSEMGRRAGYSSTHISDVINGTTNPSADFVIAVARALGESPEALLRLAGHLPDAPPVTDLDCIVTDAFRQLDDTQRNAISTVVLGLVGKSAEHAPTAPSRSGQAAPDESLLPLEDRMQQHILAICDVLLPLVDEPTHAYLMDRLNIVREQWKRERERLDQERHPDPESRSDRST